MSARTELAAGLMDALPTWKVIPAARSTFPTQPKGVDGVVILYVTEWRPAPQQLGQTELDFELWIVALTNDPEAAEDELDEHLEELLEELNKLTWLGWTSAVRAAYSEAERPAVKITATARIDL